MFKAFGCTTLICEYDQSTGLQPTKRGWKTWQIQRPAKQYNISKKRPVPKHDEHPAYFFKTLSVSLMLDVQMLLPWAKWCLKLKSSSKWLTCIESGAVQSRGKEVGVKNTLCPQKRAYCDLLRVCLIAFFLAALPGSNVAKVSPVICLWVFFLPVQTLYVCS